MGFIFLPTLNDFNKLKQDLKEPAAKPGEPLRAGEAAHLPN